MAAFPHPGGDAFQGKGGPAQPEIDQLDPVALPLPSGQTLDVP